MFVAIEILVVTLIVIDFAIAAVAVVFVFLFVIIIIATVVIVDGDVLYPCTICLLCFPRFFLLCLKNETMIIFWKFLIGRSQVRTPLH